MDIISQLKMPLPGWGVVLGLGPKLGCGGPKAVGVLIISITYPVAVAGRLQLPVVTQPKEPED